MSLIFETQPHPDPVSDERRRAILAEPGFGDHFTDHMAVATWTRADGWHDSAVVPYGPFAIDPASAVLHYAQEIFEGLKAYRHADGSIWAFRPDQNAQRFNRSAERMALPALPEEDFLAAVDALVRTDRAWVPTEGESSLYLRPFMFASEVFLGVRPTERATFAVIATPAGPYFGAQARAVPIWITETWTRAARGGTGAAKCGGNYAASLVAMQEAAAHGCAQVLFLDALEGKWVEELGGMNAYFVTRDRELVTPELGTILEGITRDAILQLASDLGLTPVQRRVDVDEILRGEFAEVFACGTAAVVSPIGVFKGSHGETVINGGEPGPVTLEIRQRLLDIQYGRTPDTHGYLRRIV